MLRRDLDGEVHVFCRHIHQLKSHRDLHVDVGVQRVEPGQPGHEPLDRNGREQPDPHRVVGSPLQPSPGRRFDCLECITDCSGVVLPRLSQHRLSSRAREQRLTEERLELANVAADCALRHVQGTRRRSKIARPGGSLERP